MLSGETAIGKFPVEAVARLRSIVTLAEAHRHASLTAAGGFADAPNDLRAATLALTRTLPISKVVVLSRTGYAARLVSMAQVRQPVIAVGRDAALARSWNLLPGTTAVFLPDLDLAAEGAGTAALKSLWEGGRLQGDDVVLVVLAASDDAQASLSSLQTVRVGQLAAQLAWSVDSGVEA